ncbi:uncharacterized protein AC631_00367 [Debaryomyces fabryi]|uniref:Uncharacterized protein n=1 Tax=Debaryomyces fabryi TaxID=58627 RepID=A0A0V1Q5Z9_9ASCO|nr:uncharacterized protein AC631_00367 [Debaryomyces fabryi]KSA03912.1 hypothetical protein AC631_00367 [Debaryomyces fabryi]CUM48814.1 unnamed protein product [Debaryomyces fabryi]
MLFLSLFSKSDTWIQIIVLAVNYYLRNKIKKFTGSFHDLDEEGKGADIDGKPPQFDLPMTHVIVDSNDATDQKAVQEEKDSIRTELKDNFNDGEDLVLKDAIIEDTE